MDCWLADANDLIYYLCYNRIVFGSINFLDEFLLSPKMSFTFVQIDGNVEMSSTLDVVNDKEYKLNINIYLPIWFF